MKKITLFLLVCIYCIGLSSCDSNTASDTLPPSQEEVESPIDSSAEMHIHTYGNWIITVEPTCTTEGVMVKSCECGDTLSEALSVIDHTEAIDPAILPSCTDTGLTEGKHCTVCKQILTEQETIPALGHTEVIDVAVSPSCSKAGLTEGKHCSVCQQILIKQESIPTIAHTEVIDAAIPPSCSKTGLTEGRHCSICNQTLVKAENIAKLSHDIGDQCSMCGLNYYEVLVAYMINNGLMHEDSDDETYYFSYAYLDTNFDNNNGTRQVVIHYYPNTNQIELVYDMLINNWSGDIKDWLRHKIILKDASGTYEYETNHTSFSPFTYTDLEGTMDALDNSTTNKIYYSYCSSTNDRVIAAICELANSSTDVIITCLNKFMLEAGLPFTMEQFGFVS